MKKLLGVENTGEGQAYLRFSDEPVVESLPVQVDSMVIIDFSDDRQIVGIEIVVLDNDTIGEAMKYATIHDLDLRPLFHASDPKAA